MKLIGKSAHRKRAEREVRRLREGIEKIIEKIIYIGPVSFTVDVILKELERLLEGPGGGDGNDQ